MQLYRHLKASFKNTEIRICPKKTRLFKTKLKFQSKNKRSYISSFCNHSKKMWLH